MGNVADADVDPAFHRCPVEVPIGGLDRHFYGVVAVRKVKTGQRGECLRR